MNRLDDVKEIHHIPNLLPVLIVDDNYDIVTLFERALTAHEFKVSAYTDPTCSRSIFGTLILKMINGNS